MSPDLVNKGLYIISFLLFILPLRDVILKTGVVWYKRISSLGWVLIAVGIANSVFTYFKSAEDAKLKPLLNVNIGPRFLDRAGDSIPVILSVKNFGKGKAKNLDASIVNIVQRGNQLIDNKFLELASSHSFFIAPEGDYTYYIQYNIGAEDSANTDFFYFKLYYTDERGEPQPDTIRQIYRLPYPAKPGNIIFDVHPEDQKIVEAFLVLEKKW
jgi:hypothetical protein